MQLRSFILGLLLVLSPAWAWAAPWSLGADAGPMLWLLKRAPVSYAMNLSPGYAITDALILEALVGLRHYSSETEFTETATVSLPLMVGARYAYKVGNTPLSLVSGMSVGGFVLLEDDRDQEKLDQSVRFEPAGRFLLGADYYLLEHFSLGLNTVLEVTPKNLFLSFGLGGRVYF